MERFWLDPRYFKDVSEKNEVRGNITETQSNFQKTVCDM
jgi:hypothetical protein